ncbi:MAG: DUF2834 domain-containing protein, partial [bacterium]
MDPGNPRSASPGFPAVSETSPPPASIPGPAGRQAPLPPLAWLYLVLAIAGGVLPWLANVAFLREHGPSFNLALFVDLANANPAAQSLSRDLAVGATAVTIWMISESRRLRMRGLPWVLLS